jgi:hypothetical protein
MIDARREQQSVLSIESFLVLTPPTAPLIRHLRFIFITRCLNRPCPHRALMIASRSVSKMDVSAAARSSSLCSQTSTSSLVIMRSTAMAVTISDVERNGPGLFANQAGQHLREIWRNLR